MEGGGCSHRTKTWSLRNTRQRQHYAKSGSRIWCRACCCGVIRRGKEAKLKTSILLELRSKAWRKERGWIKCKYKKESWSFTSVVHTTKVGTPTTEHRVKTNSGFFTQCLKKKNPTSHLVQVRPAVLNLWSMYRFQGSVNLDGEKITTYDFHKLLIEI